MRNLEREIGTVCRKIARQVAESSNGKPAADDDLRARACASCSAARASSPRRKRRTRQPGVATGLAWTPVGGDVLFIEATAYAGQGQADDHRPARRRDARVRAGGALLRAQPSRASWLPASTLEWFAEHDIHIHVPAGATPKDGPSAGITMATALVVAHQRAPRARRRRDDRRDHADRAGAADRRAQGEGARRAAQRDHAPIIAPALNERDIEDIPEHLRDDLEFVFVEEIGEVLAAALEPRGRRPTAGGARVQPHRPGYRIAIRTASDVWR